MVVEQNKHLVPAVVKSYLDWIVPLLAVLLTLFILYLLGLFTANVFGRRIIRFIERAVDKVPMVKTVYRSTKQVVMMFGGPETMNFRRVVLVELPRPGMKRIAFLTSVLTDTDTGRQLANVFIPYTPYVATGYMQIVPVDELSETNWTVEEAVKLIMSGGIVSPPSIPFERPRPLGRIEVDEEPSQPVQIGSGMQPPNGPIME